MSGPWAFITAAKDASEATAGNG
ncbi:hypothetical protein HaLaN_15828 [Haematococcus lacustris]|uniref:Uncharacterized protein n=1 Tax=Haematococcus lacustris TaxID=44745 RepID=A0A699ZHK8_HAELA|nr:hypothetical protein HaLaN_15828 [Haematococcus lacustris]